MRKLIFLCLIIPMVLFCSINPAVGYAQTESSIKILCLGKYIEADVDPFFADSRIMAPVRAVFESLGAEVEWDDTQKTATGKLGEKVVVLTLGSNIITVDGKDVEMDTVLAEKGDRVFAPIRFVAESFGYKVCYHDESSTAVISAERVYDFYDSLKIALPEFSDVTGAALISTGKDEEGNDVFSYSYTEDYATDYFNAIQADFGYVLSSISFKDGAHVYDYRSSNSGHSVRVADFDKNQDVVCITVIPDLSGEYKSDYSASEPLVGMTPGAESEKEPLESQEINPEQNSLDYGAVTGARFIGRYDAEDGSYIYRYEYNMFTHSAYENFLVSNGWKFYDFDFDIMDFINTTYYAKGDEMLSVSTAHMFGEVWVVYP